jgi:hypothetical protein
VSKKQLIFIFLIALSLLSGCNGRASLAKGGGKYTIPFDFPSEQDDLNNEKILAQNKSAENDPDKVKVSGDVTVTTVDREGF